MPVLTETRDRESGLTSVCRDFDVDMTAFIE